MDLLRWTGERLRSFGRVSDQPGQERSAAWYDARYLSGREKFVQDYARSHYYFLWTVITDRVRRAGVRSVLEIGCGAGQLARLLLDQGVEQYVGLDMSPAAVELAQRHSPEARFEVADARTSDIYTRVAYDAVVCTEVLEHVTEDLLIVSRFAPGARCYCSVPSFPWMSHVRNFADADAVHQRYGPFFDDADVLALRSPRNERDTFFLLEGVRNHYVPDELR